jgi:predicted GNAT family N-acyltransferase
MKIKVKIINPKKEHEMCLAIRRQVFILEQNISKQIETDDHLVNATHILAFSKEKAVGTARYRRTDSGIKLERFAVLKQFRNLGIGKALVLFILEKLKNLFILLLRSRSLVFMIILDLTQLGNSFTKQKYHTRKWFTLVKF